MWKKIVAAALALVAGEMAPTCAAAQGLEALGGRAAALGAFVAVADDGLAVAWNPAGLVMGPIVKLSVDFGHSRSGDPDPPRLLGRAGELGVTALALGLPPIGLAYYRLSTVAQAASGPAAGGGPDRQDRHVTVRSLVTSHLGATVLQSLGDFITLGATVKLVHGAVAADVTSVGQWKDGFERAEVLDARGTTTADVDLGAMLGAGRLRAGVVVRNVTEPTFEGDGGSAAELSRHVRAGAAWGDRWPGVAGTIVAMDIDLTRVPHPAGDRRDLAAGAERWLTGRRIGLRAGVRASTVGEARPIASAGASYALRAGTYVDGFIARGRAADHGWGIGVRVVY